MDNRTHSHVKNGMLMSLFCKIMDVYILSIWILGYVLFFFCDYKFVKLKLEAMQYASSDVNIVMMIFFELFLLRKISEVRVPLGNSDIFLSKK